MAVQSVNPVPAGMWAADTMNVAPGDGTVRLANADPLRRSVTIYTDPDSAGVLWLVPNSGQRSGGIRIIPGAGFSFEHGAEVHGYATGGACVVGVVSESGAVC